MTSDHWERNAVSQVGQMNRHKKCNKNCTAANSSLQGLLHYYRHNISWFYYWARGCSVYAFINVWQTKRVSVWVRNGVRELIGNVISLWPHISVCCSVGRSVCRSVVILKKVREVTLQHFYVSTCFLRNKTGKIKRKKKNIPWYVIIFKVLYKESFKFSHLRERSFCSLQEPDVHF